MRFYYAEHAESRILNTGMGRGWDHIKHGMNWSDYPESFRAELKFLWDKPVIILISERENRQTLWCAQIIEFQNGEVVTDTSYFFCREVMIEIAKYLELQIDSETQSCFEQPWLY